MKFIIAVLFTAIAFLAALLIDMNAVAAVPGGASKAKTTETKVIELTTPEQVKAELAKAGPIILLYSADWCGFCKEFEPDYDQMSTVFTNLRFYKVNADKIGLKEHAKLLKGVPAIFVGRNEDQLRNKPCELGKEGRGRAKLKAEIIDCLGTLP